MDMRFLEERDRVLLRLFRGEEVVSSLQDFAQERRIPHAVVNGIGAIEDVTIGAYDLSAGKYRRRTLEGDWEVISLMGNLGWANDLAFLHAHAMLGDLHCNVLGGHLFQATVHVTMEVVLWTGTLTLQRTHDEEVGLKLWNLPNEAGPGAA
jgi:predicted DNA-binding protein with PD1-like motif